MGPRPESRGYVIFGGLPQVGFNQLQWVHGLKAVVMGVEFRPVVSQVSLQWGHGLKAVVM